MVLSAHEYAMGLRFLLCEIHDGPRHSESLVPRGFVHGNVSSSTEHPISALVNRLTEDFIEHRGERTENNRTVFDIGS